MQMETTNFANIFNSAKAVKETAEKTYQQEHSFNILLDVEDEFRIEMNQASNRIRFIKYKEPNTQKATELDLELDSLKREYQTQSETLSEDDEQLKLLSYQIKKVSYQAKLALATEMYSGWYLKPKANMFSEEDIQTLASIVYQPGKKVSLYSILYRLGAPLVINGSFKQIDIEKIPVNLCINCEQRVADAQDKQLGKGTQEVSLTKDPLENDDYIDLMDSERESI